ncbi:hypothetical protein C1645_821723 [Glomus cerebriforme]|uniref:Uncharacterized protein n=1 Tax=Glomus cerebriforme TaxID=658196 RepID=A0A397T2S2_9GLOM|nr:hypothetical protein C1645_821723 [Glomus cerebriforme]
MSELDLTKQPCEDILGLHDDLPMEQVVAWDCLIKWGIEQTPGLGSENSDRTKCNNENYKELRKL